MREHIYEVYYYNIQIISRKRIHLLQEFVACHRVVDFMIRETVVATIALYLSFYQRTLVEVLAFFLVFVYPQVWKHLRNLVRHQTTKYSVASILSGSRKNGVI